MKIRTTIKYHGEKRKSSIDEYNLNNLDQHYEYIKDFYFNSNMIQMKIKYTYGTKTLTKLSSCAI